MLRQDEKPTTNADLMDRLDVLEEKVDKLCNKMEQANGAWFFIKLMASVAVGLVVLYNGIHGWFTQ